MTTTFSTFLAMVHKEFTIMLRYPVEFVASFGQIFLIVTVFSLAGAMFSPGGLDGTGNSQSTGLVVYGFILFHLSIRHPLGNWGQIRREQKQGTLEQLYLSPASKLASLSARVTLTQKQYVFWSFACKKNVVSMIDIGKWCIAIPHAS